MRVKNKSEETQKNMNEKDELKKDNEMQRNERKREIPHLNFVSKLLVINERVMIKARHRNTERHLKQKKTKFTQCNVKSKNTSKHHTIAGCDL